MAWSEPQAVEVGLHAGDAQNMLHEGSARLSTGLIATEGSMSMPLAPTAVAFPDFAAAINYFPSSFGCAAATA